MDTGGPAYPVAEWETNYDCQQPYSRFLGTTNGMTLRDYFAGQALIGFLAAFGRVEREVTNQFDVSDVAGKAYIYADAMIAEKRRTEAQ